LFASRLTVNSSASSPWAIVVLPVCFALSGFAGIVYQIAWTRQFALVFGTTETAITLVLAAYMAGLGLAPGWSNGSCPSSTARSWRTQPSS
jgi:spermidine synthase